MFKHYLTYHFASGFERLCIGAQFNKTLERDELIRCSRNVALFFEKAIRATDTKESAKNLFVALTYLRDCKDVMDRNEIHTWEIRTHYQVLCGRLETLFWESSEADQGQLRMLG
ncbi:MAG: hypothetical protein AABZ55_13755 [Bdellovibrionota bacterium]